MVVYDGIPDNYIWVWKPDNEESWQEGKDSSEMQLWVQGNAWKLKK